MTDRPLLEGPPEPGSPGDTLTDKAIRFAIGAGLASLALLSLALLGIAEFFDLTVLLGGSFLAVALAGVFSITHGERFIEEIGRLIRWLA